jgi:hypothetical protein
MSDQGDLSPNLSQLVMTVEEYDRLIADALPELLDHAAAETRKFLRETGQWADDVAHEKLALRWGYELVERFLMAGRTEVPCRPLFFLDSLMAKYFSQPDPLGYDKQLLSPVGRFLDAIASRAVVSRDALMALFYHFYGFGQGQVAKVLGLGATEAQRVYKNFERWRRGGWQRTVEELGITTEDLREIEQQKAAHPERFNAEALRLSRVVQSHYRKSEPEHFRCLTHEQWLHLFGEGYGYDYRAWHLALCQDCLAAVCQVRQDWARDLPAVQFDLRIRPVFSGRTVESCHLSQA